MGTLIALSSISVVLARNTLKSWKTVRPTTWIWVGVFALLLILEIGVGFANLYVGNSIIYAYLFFVTGAAGLLALSRDSIHDTLKERWPFAWNPRWVLNAIAVIASIFLAFAAERITWAKTNMPLFPFCEVLEIGLIALLVLAAHFLSQRHGGGAAVVVVALTFAGIAQYYISSFKGSAILPNDLLVLGTAAAVSSNYSYEMGTQVLNGAIFAVVALGLLAHVCPSRTRRAEAIAEAMGAAPNNAATASNEAVGTSAEKFDATADKPEATLEEDKTDAQPAKVRRPRRLIVATCCNLAAALVFGGIFTALVTIPNYREDFDIYIENYWYSLDYYNREGLLPSFVSAFQDMAIKVPDGYTQQGAQAIEDQLAEDYEKTLATTTARTDAEKQFEDEQPTVIAIMNESYSDLSIFNGESWGYTGPQYLNNGLTGTLRRGDLSVSVYSGGTCNTELEFLTGISLNAIGSGKYAYSLYDLKDIAALPKQFKEAGYSTTAIHPNLATNWSRNIRYAELGFDQFLDIDSFQDAEYYHAGVSDGATYDKILELLRDNDEPQFIFDVTMQNHSGYDKGNIPAEEVLTYAPVGITEHETTTLNEYLACVNKSDQYLETFIQQLSELDRPVVLVFFGDHQPRVSEPLNEKTMQDSADDATHTQRIYQTVYFFWANYDVAGSEAADAHINTSSSYLGSQLMYQIGGPLNEYQEAQLVLAEDVPEYNLLGWKDASQTWYLFDESETTEEVNELQQLGYLNFAQRL